MALSEVIMPKTGAEMEEGKIISWKKQPGERIAAGEILLEIETDKATMDVESPARGVLLRSLFPANEKVPATHLIAVIGEGNESAEEIDRFIKGITHPGSATDTPTAPAASAPAPAAAPEAGSKTSDHRLKASPLARRLAQEKGIDLAAIQGSGPDGRIELLSWETNGFDYTGRLAEITERGGGTVTFNYNPNSLGNDGINCIYLQPTALTRTTTDGTGISYSNSFAVGGAGNTYETVTKLDIAKNKTIYQFSGYSSTGLAAWPVAQILTYRATYINTGTLSLPTYSGTPTTQSYYCYNGTAYTTACATAGVTLPITEADVYTSSNGMGMSAASRTQTEYDGGTSGTCNATTGIGCYGNVTYVAQYDFGATTPLWSMTNVYSATGGCVSGSTIKNKLCSSTSGTGGHAVATSRYSYDAYGNLLVTSVSPNGGTSYLANTTLNTYNSNGTPSATYDLAGNKTTYVYASGSYTGSPTNLPFATKITSPNGLYTQASYDSGAA